MTDPAQTAPVSRDTPEQCEYTQHGWMLGGIYAHVRGDGLIQVCPVAEASEDTEPARCWDCGADDGHHAEDCSVILVDPAPASDDEKTPGPSDCEDCFGVGGWLQDGAWVPCLKHVPPEVEAAIRAPLEIHVYNLLARIFRDGGQRAQSFPSLDAAVAQANIEAAGYIAVYSEQLAVVTAERDRLRGAAQHVFDWRMLDINDYDAKYDDRQRHMHDGTSPFDELAAVLAAPATEEVHAHGLTQVWCDQCGDLPCEHAGVPITDGRCERCGAATEEVQG